MHPDSISGKMQTSAEEVEKALPLSLKSLFALDLNIYFAFYFQPTRVKAYLANMRVVTDEDELHRMSEACEPPPHPTGVTSSSGEHQGPRVILAPSQQQQQQQQPTAAAAAKRPSSPNPSSASSCSSSSGRLKQRQQLLQQQQQQQQQQLNNNNLHVPGGNRFGRASHN